MLHGIKYPFGHFRSAAQIVSAPNFLPPPAYSLSGSRAGRKESRDVAQALLSNNQNAGVLLMLF